MTNPNVHFLLLIHPTAAAADPSHCCCRRRLPQVAFVAGVADSSGYGWAICKALAEAGATVTVGTWPPVLGIFEKSLKKGSFDEDMKLDDGSKFEIAKVYPLDAVYDAPEDVPEDVKTNKRYAGLSGYTIEEVASQIKADYGQVSEGEIGIGSKHVINLAFFSRGGLFRF